MKNLNQLLGKLNPFKGRPANQLQATDTKLLNSMFDIAADALFVVDDRQRILRSNRAAERIFGYESADLLGQPIDMLIPPRFTKAHQKHIHNFADGRIAAHLMGERDEIFGLRKDGEEFAAEASISKVVEAGRPFFLVILRDISVRKQLEEELRQSGDRFRRIFDYSNDAVFIIDPMHSQFVDVNPKACEMFGFSREEFSELTVADIHPKDSPKFKVFSKSIMDQGVGWTDELTCLTKSGDELPAEVSASLMDISERRVMIAIFRDISERKAVERMREAFVSNVSHELRTPITSIKLYQDLLNRDTEKREIYLDRLARETNRLQHLVEDLLQLSRLDQDRFSLTLAPVALNALAERYTYDRTPLAENQHLQLQVVTDPDLPMVRGEERLLGQILSILLTNAFNYTPDSGTVTVSTHFREASGHAWAGLRVSDTGLGIQPDERDKLFERFYRGSAGEKSGAAGTGLGLPIAKEIIERHAGCIEVESEGVSGKGSRFTVWLPVETVGLAT